MLRGRMGAIRLETWSAVSALIDRGKHNAWRSHMGLLSKKHITIGMMYEIDLLK